MDTFTFTDAHQAQLEQFLNDQGGQFHSLQQLSGFLFATVCSPDGVEVEQWLNQIVEEPDATSESLVFALMALHHSISEAVYSDGYQLPWDEHSAYQQQHHWAIGFVMGVTPYFEKLLSADELEDELKEALQISVEQLAFYGLEESALQTYCQQVGMEYDVFNKQQSELAQEFSQGFAELIEAAALGSGLYNEATAE